MITVHYPKINRNNAWYSYLLHGFQKLAEDNVIGLIITNKIISYSPALIPIDIQVKQQKYKAFYDYSDFLPLLSKEEIPYFKIQYNPIHFKKKHIFPIGQTCTNLEIIRYMPNLYKQKKTNKYDIVAMFRATNFKLRCDCIDLILQQKWKSLAGISGYRNRPIVPKHLYKSKISYLDHLEAQCQSKICVSLPGVGKGTSFWSWRATEILALGNCMLTTRPTCFLPNHPSDCWIEVEEDLSDFITKVNYYLKHEKERKQIAKNGKKYFDAYLSPEAMCKNLINQTLEYYNVS